jgi:hypothetical protein
MLLSRFQVINGYVCTEHKGHVTDTSSLIFHQLSYLGYADSKAEMKLLLLSINDPV